MPTLRFVNMSDVDPDLPPTDVELAYRRGYVHGAFAATDYRRVSMSRVCRWLDSLEAWRRLAGMAKLHGQERFPQSPPPTL